ncbi:MAG: hypothetical protein ACYDCN_11405 [Bacteroidia bacterium]
MSKSFYNSYKDKLSKLSEEPTDDVWENIISKAINADEHAPKEKKKRRGLVVFVILLSITLLSSLLLLLTPIAKSGYGLQIADNNNLQKLPLKSVLVEAIPTKRIIKSSNKKGVATDNSSTLTSSLKNNFTKNIESKNTTSPTTGKKHSVSKQSANEIFATQSESNEDQENSALINDDGNNSSVIIPIELVKISDIKIPTEIKATLADKDNLPLIKDSVAEKIKPQIKQGGLAVGLSYVCNNPWLLNYVTYNSFDKNKPEIMKSSFNSSFLVFATYSVKKLNIQLECIFNNKYEQNYQTYSEGHAYKKELSLSYTQFNLIDKFNFLNKQKNSLLSYQLNFLTGAGYGYLNSAQKYTNNNVENVAAKYSNSNITLITGIEYQLKLNRWLFSTSLRGNFGVNNIYKGDIVVPQDLNKTYNSGLYVTCGIGYLIK